MNWFRFWNQFQIEIDLKELTVSNVCSSFKGMSFTTEGYQRAKSILQTKYGKTSDITCMTH